MRNLTAVAFTGIAALGAACGSAVAPPPRVATSEPPKKEQSAPMPRLTTFSDDVAFLSRYGAISVLESPTGGRIAVSGKYQARVMTSAVEPEGLSLGYVNRAFIEERKTGTQFDNYGGEDRFWLGPEGGQYGLYFPPGQPFEFAYWQTPRAMQEGEWEAKVKSATSATFIKALSVVNHLGTRFEMEIERRIALLSAEQAAEQLGGPIPAGAKWIGYASSNAVTNLGTNRWVEGSGLPSIWILGMFAPLAGTRVIVPFEKGTGEIVNDRYFGKVPADRLAVRESEGFLSFKCDGRYRSKIGLGPQRAKPVLGSYSAEAKILTVVIYDKPKGATRYVNSMWEEQRDPYGGDVVNSYNDGANEAGAGLGGFYEIETSSPAAALLPGTTLTHVHRTFHFTGPEEALDAIARQALGVTLAQITST